MNASFCENNAKYNPTKTMLNNGIYVDKKIASTLQGSVYKGKIINTNKNVIIKRTSKSLHKRKIAKIPKYKNTFVKVKENIIKEAKILSLLNQENNNNNNNNSIQKVKGIPKLFKFIFDNINYFLIMEYCGSSLFDHIKKCHDMIKINKLTIHVYLQHIKILFNQMVNIVNYLHNIKNVCHLDISLENFTIKNVKIHNGNIINHGQIYLIDFGVSEYFGINSNYLCNKRVGKVKYQSPEVYNNKLKYNAKLQDSWSLGVCLFIMHTGFEPYNEPTINDDNYYNIINGFTKQMLIDSNILIFMNDPCIDLINNIMTFQHKRYFIDDIITHHYLK